MQFTITPKDAYEPIVMKTISNNKTYNTIFNPTSFQSSYSINTATQHTTILEPQQLRASYTYNTESYHYNDFVSLSSSGKINLQQIYTKNNTSTGLQIALGNSITSVITANALGPNFFTVESNLFEFRSTGSYGNGGKYFRIDYKDNNRLEYYDHDNGFQFILGSSSNDYLVLRSDNEEKTFLNISNSSISYSTENSLFQIDGSGNFSINSTYLNGDNENIRAGIRSHASPMGTSISQEFFKAKVEKINNIDREYYKYQLTQSDNEFVIKNNFDNNNNASMLFVLNNNQLYFGHPTEYFEFNYAPIAGEPANFNYVNTNNTDYYCTLSNFRYGFNADRNDISQTAQTYLATFNDLLAVIADLQDRIAVLENPT